MAWCPRMLDFDPDAAGHDELYRADPTELEDPVDKVVIVGSVSVERVRVDGDVYSPGVKWPMIHGLGGL
jgi:hypothetical protein